MNKYLLIVFSFFLFLPPLFSANITYTISNVTKPFPMVKIEMNCPACEIGDYSEFVLKSNFSALRDLEKEVHGLEAFGKNGRKLLVLRGGHRGARTKKDSWSIGKTQKGERLLVSYYLVPTRPNISWPTRKRLVLTKSLLHFLGNSVLLRPIHLDGSCLHSITVKWQGFKESGWQVASSFSSAQDKFTVKRKLDDFLLSSFMAGPLRIVEESVDGHTVCCAIPGTRWKFKDEDLLYCALNILQSARTFFKEKDRQRLFIGLIPIPTKKPMPSGSAGLGLTSSILLYLNPGESLQWLPAKGKELKHVIAHEIMHKWFGGTIKAQSPTGYVIWFLEGFADFYARRLLRNCGEITDKQFIAAINQVMDEYLHSPVRELNNHNLLRNYNRRSDVRRLPYLRGALIAAHLDDEIRSFWKGKKTLDTFMFHLLATSRKHLQRRFSNEDLFKTIGEFTNKEVVKRMRRYIVNGDLLPLPPKNMEGELKYEIEHVYSPPLARLLRIKTAEEGGHGKGKDPRKRLEAFVPLLHLRQ